ncbi:hypothetical protein H2204_005446 [Knufia peltigerae]|uniref:Alpha/beta hydrolase fold-3 domain-containing protein n=1 Tax=Knufia peltigerae TaxID=1002370 RepID=A0AA38Y5I4_9EURO|nr:hypothetical protein H2204_005446 [Knufia peltigerae]
MTYLQSWLDLEKELGGRPLLQGSVEEMRAQVAELGQKLMSRAPTSSDAVESRDGYVESVRYRVYTPNDASKQGPLPVGIWTHGGGWSMGDINDDDLLCRFVAEHIPSILVNVEYRLAPEHKVPTQLQDTLAVYEWARQNAHSFGGDPNKFYTIGGSAGGALALQVANHIVNDPSKRKNIRGVAAIVPATLHFDYVPEEYKSIYKAYKENEKDTPLIDKEAVRTFFEATAVDPRDSTFFTALATDNHQNFPPVYLVSCEKDPLRDDAYVMEAALKRAGVPTKHDTYKGLGHYFWIFPSLPEGQQFVENLIGGIQWLISQM